MSRLIVKGLPKYFTEDNLRKHFGEQGDVTDVKLVKSKNGESRRFAFIGYKSRESAEKAVKFFNKSFLDTARIDVEIAKTFSDPNVPISFREKRKRDNERLRRQEEALIEQNEMAKNVKRQKPKSAIEEEMENDPKFREYMEVMKPSHEVKSWANDAIADGSGGRSAKELEDALAGDTKPIAQNYDVIEAKESASDDEYEDFSKIEARKGGEEGEEGEEDKEEEMMMMMSLDNVENNLAKDENVSDLDWLKSRSIRIKENGEVPESALENDSLKQNEGINPLTVLETTEVLVPVSKSVQKTEEEKTLEKLQDTGRLFIRNILYEATEDDFRELFLPYGALEEVHIAIDTRTSKSKGFVYIQFVNPQDAVRAYSSLDKEIFQGRLLHILAADRKKSHRLDEFDLKNLPLKKQRELKRKEQAVKTQFSWNSLFMNTDAVMESMAAKLGVTKSQLIDPENSSSAVKQALAEAHVIGDVKKFFEDKGVDLTSFNKKERDDKIILVKNFTYGTTTEELGELFSQYGPIARIIMPPAGTIAIVEFKDAPSARAAFTKLAYKRFNSSILYLEKGPKDLFTRAPTTAEEASLNVGIGADTAGTAGVAGVAGNISQPVKAVEVISANDILGQDIDDTEDGDIHGSTVSIFVKNLNFSTTVQQLSDLFKPLSGFVLATVKTKPDPKNTGKTLSMGFGFVEFRSKAQADAAIAALDGHVLDGHKLQLKISHKQSGGAKDSRATAVGSAAAKSGKSNKIIIKNLPFEATRKDLLELFGAFGSLKSVRVPKKFDQSARGFAFIEFNLLKEAENAMTQLEGVHLLGRRLVMQYAERDADNAEAEIERMTKKVKKQVGTQNMAAARLAGKSKIELEEKQDEFDV
ncbi:multiple RNA-binding domain-containing protein 1 [Lodderomyces elongisporus NRRL YB-4239]|uniref:Multiple RNA-binding domain-containing protein 1 n=1 Tax=Lodderomyces elongisporus (strain ATCC 11503 / CBS 2605 / JCM 1781 / NBRC 1676 / NRRL YB-4239) TaxID=379508 RepID=A5DZY8_LODEL|nr:multiple RNA-binding domain-containing protein 1 [Lodderomyces elongisporus NRRL YB-4239]